MIISDVEQGSVEWHSLRQGKVTGSRIERVFGTKAARQGFIYELVSERMCEPEINTFCNDAMQWGNDHEVFAVEASSKERDLNFEVCGMMISETMPMFGFSPDAVCYEDNGNMIGGLETKCPASKTHVEYLINGVVPKKYKWQVWAPFLMSKNIEWWDFASFDPRNYSRPLFITRVNREDIKEEIKKAEFELIKFLSEADQAHKSLVF